MYAALFLVCVVAYATAVLATIRIEYPGGVEYWWVASSPNVVGWSCEADAPAEYYDLVLQNYDDSLLAKPTILARNISHWDCMEVLNLAGNLAEGGGYYLQLVDADLATVYAMSEPFEIKSKDAGYPSTCINSTSTAAPRPTRISSPTCACSTATFTHAPHMSTPTAAPSANAVAALVAGHTELETGERRSPTWDTADWLAFFLLGALMF
ncbi:hypothetical protein GGG16DRAFT_109187 [Schizophyllum commune]